MLWCLARTIPLCELNMLKPEIVSRHGLPNYEVTSIYTAAFLNAQSQPDRHLLRFAEISADPTRKQITIRCSAATRRALQLKDSALLPEWKYQIETK